jgi:hypothetical protein
MAVLFSSGDVDSVQPEIINPIVNMAVKKIDNF